MKKVRNSNIELLRIISMLMIVVNHWTVHNNVINYTIEMGFNRLLLEWTKLGNIGVIIFVMITGYFLGKSKSNFSLKKMLKIWLQVLFYSTSIYFLLVVLEKQPFSWVSLLKSFIPVIAKEYWFVYTFFILMFLTPIINKYINNIKRNEFTKLLKKLTILFIFLPILSIILTIIKDFLQIQIDFYVIAIIQFIYFYLIGAYIGKYEVTILKKHSIKILIISVLILLISPILIIYLSKFKPDFVYYSNILFKRNSLICVLISVSLVSIFANKPIFYNKAINYSAGTMFAVYLISDNKYVRKILWTELLCVGDYVLSKYLIVNLLLSVLIIFIVCIIIEIIRKNTIERLTNWMLDKLIKE